MPTFPMLCPQEIPPVCQGFFNRAIDIYQICLKVMRQPMNRESREPEIRILTLTGETGVGKTNVAYAVARYICERRVFAAGVHVYNVEGIVKRCRNKRCDVSTIESKVRTKLQSIKSTKAEDVHALIVLDNVDCFLQDSIKNASFNAVLSKIFSKYPSIKIMLTSRTKLTLSREIPNCLEYCYDVACFSMEDSAKLLMQLAPRALTFNEMHRSSGRVVNDTTTSREHNETIRTLAASHPALIATGGNPKKISKLALRLNTRKMDEL